MVNVLLTHEVADFAQWKQGFDSGEEMRTQNGVKTLGVFNAVDNPNLVTVMAEFSSAEAVHGFMANPALQASMEKAGLVGRPDVKILNKVS